jgi:uncharacterized protein (DUF2147 family)
MQDKRFGFAAGFACLSVALLSLATPASAAEPTGEWLVEDGVARVRVEKCTDKYWGVVSWEKTPGGLDTNNPDPAKRTRPTLGMPILLGMAPGEPDTWEGEIYNSRNGKTYSARIMVKQPDVLRVEGCLVGGFLCGGQNWSRFQLPPPPGRPPTPAQVAAANAEFCSKLPVLPGPPH